MSASHRSIARLSLDIFTDLSPNQQDDPESLRSKIAAKLQQVPTRSGKPITTVGSLLQLSSPALLRALDPILCHGMLKYNVMWRVFVARMLLTCIAITINRRMSRTHSTNLSSLCSFSNDCIGLVAWNVVVSSSVLANGYALS